MLVLPSHAMKNYIDTTVTPRPRVEKALLITNGCQHYYKGGTRKKEEIFGDLG